MSSVIKMDVPESCAACKLSFLAEQPEGHYDRICPLLQREVDDYELIRPADCWFVQRIPKEHGNLINIDRFIEVIANHAKSSTILDQIAYLGLKELLELAPVIIAAETEESDQPDD